MQSKEQADFVISCEINPVHKDIVMGENKNDSYVRWQGRTIEQMGYAINTILVITLASIGFSVVKLLKANGYYCGYNFIKIGVAILFICVTTTMVLILLRLIGFRETAKIARKREKGNLDGIEKMRNHVKCLGSITWYLFYGVIASFVIGHLLIGIGLYHLI